MKKHSVSDNKREDPNYSLFPDLKVKKAANERIIRDELNIAEYPIAILAKHTNKNKLTIKLDPNREWTLVGNKEVGGLPCAHNLDYFYVLLDMLYEQTGFEDKVIYFTIYELIRRAGKEPSKNEYRRAIESLEKYRWLIIRSKTFKVLDENEAEIKFLNEDISLIQHYSILGGLGKGRKKKIDESTDGYCMVIFSDYFISNLRSKELSKKLNFTFMMKLSTPLGRRYFRLIDMWKEITNMEDDLSFLEKDIFEIGKLLPLSDHKYVSTIQRYINPVHEELKKLNYLRDVNYVKKNGTTFVQYIFSPFNIEQTLAMDELIQNGIAPAVAQNFALNYDPHFILDVLRYAKIKSKKQSIKPGYIVKTIQEGNHQTIKSFIDNYYEENRKKRRKSEYLAKEKALLFYNQYLDSEIDKMINELTDAEKEKLTKEVRTNMAQFASEKTKNLAIEGAIRTYLKGKLVLPSFDEWNEQNRDKIGLI